MDVYFQTTTCGVLNRSHYYRRRYKTVRGACRAFKSLPGGGFEHGVWVLPAGMGNCLSSLADIRDGRWLRVTKRK